MGGGVWGVGSGVWGVGCGVGVWGWGLGVGVWKLHAGQERAPCVHSAARARAAQAAQAGQHPHEPYPSSSPFATRPLPNPNHSLSRLSRSRNARVLPPNKPHTITRDRPPSSQVTQTSPRAQHFCHIAPSQNSYPDPRGSLPPPVPPQQTTNRFHRARLAVTSQNL